MTRKRWRKITTWVIVAFVAMVLSAFLALHFIAGPRGIPDGWRADVSPPSFLSQDAADFNFDVTPLEAGMDCQVAITATGLKPDEEVVIRASTSDAKDQLFQSWARFRADSAGSLDLSQTAPIEGSYRSADSNGLLWSMRADDDALFYTSLDWNEREYEIRIETTSGFEVKKLKRLYPSTMLECEEVSGSGVEGQLWYPSTKKPLPVIIRMGGWDGGPSPVDCGLIAAKGYAVLDLGYHARKNLPKELVGVPLETVTRAIDWLEKHPRLDGSRIGIFGVSKGAELALLSAAREPRIRAVVAWAPSSVAFEGISFRRVSSGSSWTQGGEDVPFASSSFGSTEARNSARAIMGRPMKLLETYQNALDDAAPEARIAVENIQGPILLAAGSDDQMWPSSTMAKQIARRLERKSFPHRVISVIADDAGHNLDYSLWPSGGGPSSRFVRGGNPESNHLGGQKAWTETIRFLSESLGDPDE